MSTLSFFRYCDARAAVTQRGGLSGKVCTAVSVVASGPPLERARYSKTPESLCSFSFVPPGRSLSRNMGPTLWDCNVFLISVVTAQLGRSCTSSAIWCDQNRTISRIRSRQTRAIWEEKKRGNGVEEEQVKRWLLS